MSIGSTLLAHLRKGKTAEETGIVQYSDEIQFSQLWSDKWADLFGCSDPAHRLIVWDGQPSGNRLLLPHLTPLDWALAVSLRLLSTGADVSAHKWSLHIVDLTLGDHRGAWAQHHAAALLDAMPWVRLYAPLQLKRRAYEPSRLDSIISGDFGRVSTFAGSIEGRLDSTLANLRSLSQSWQGSLHRSDDHHDLNNLVAPVLLSASVQPGDVELSLHAFAAKCNWIGAVTDSPPQLRDMHTTVADALSTLPTDTVVRVVMVDDMAYDGWAELVQQWLGITDRIQFCFESAPRSFLRALELCTAERFRVRSYCSVLYSMTGPSTSDEVLIWDLRLFGKALFYQVIRKFSRMQWQDLPHLQLFQFQIFHSTDQSLKCVLRVSMANLLSIHTRRTSNVQISN